MWQPLYHPDVEKKDLPKIPGNIQVRIKKAIELRLLQDPVSSGEALRKSLKGYKKLRVRDYRIIYRIEKPAVLILKIGHRKEVYQKAVRKIATPANTHWRTRNEDREKND